MIKAKFEYWEDKERFNIVTNMKECPKCHIIDLYGTGEQKEEHIREHLAYPKTDLVLKEALSELI